MKVFVNDIEVDIFRGGRAKDAILKYYSQSGKRFKKQNLDIRDEWQNTIEIAELEKVLISMFEY